MCVVQGLVCRAPKHCGPCYVGVLPSHNRAEEACSLQYADIAGLIDVEQPYYALFDVSAPRTLQTTYIHMPVSGKFRTESAMGREEGIPIGAGELARHCAVLGSVACAAANPVKRKHYYLAAKAGHRLLEGVLDKSKCSLRHDCCQQTFLTLGLVFNAPCVRVTKVTI
jgi:hypothetical protein